MSKHPPYHLRPNKAVDRCLFVELLQRIDKRYSLSSYTYHGLGGPFLDEFRLLAEFFPAMDMISLEKDHETWRRQKFHKPTAKLSLRQQTAADFIKEYRGNSKGIFWLDYPWLEFSAFEDFMRLLTKVASLSIVKVSLPARYRRRAEKNTDLEKEFEEEFSKVIPSKGFPSLRREWLLAPCLQEMLKIASQRALGAATGRQFQILCSCIYSDGTPMLTVTGIVVDDDAVDEVRELFRDWEYANLDWGKPNEIDVPVLTTKERLKLDEFLPAAGSAGKMLLEKLGYSIERSREAAVRKMDLYARFYRHYPHFIRAIP